MKNNKVVIIGAGIGGLASAALLAKDGYDVTIIEKNSNIGGRARIFKEKGFLFDMGPSWYMMPDVFEKYFELFGLTPGDFYQLDCLDTHYKIYLENKNQYIVSTDFKKNIELFEKAEKGAGAKFVKFIDQCHFIYDFVIKDLIYNDYQSMQKLIKPKLIYNLPKLKLLRTFDEEVKRFFKNPDLQKILEFTTVFLGGSPYNTPAFYTLITHTDFNLKIWHPKGGINKFIEALIKLNKKYHVKINTKEPVRSIEIKDGIAKKVITDKKQYQADIIINNSDYNFCETKLLESKWQSYPEKYWQKKTLSPTAFVIYLGINKKLKDVEHHNFYFDDSWLTHFKEVFKQPEWPEKPSYYVHVPTKTDSSLAPKGCDIVYFLIPVAPGMDDNDKIRHDFSEKVISHFEGIIGQNFKKNILVQRIFSHRDFIDNYNSYQGTAFGLAHTLFQTALFRPKNKSKKVKNLYYVGQYTNPGIGMPLCLISSQIVFNLIKKEYH